MRSVYIYRMKEEKTIFKPLAGIAGSLGSIPGRTNTRGKSENV